MISLSNKLIIIGARQLFSSLNFVETWYCHWFFVIDDELALSAQSVTARRKHVMFFVGPVRLLPGHIHAGVDVEGKVTVVDIRPQTL